MFSYEEIHNQVKQQLNTYRYHHSMGVVRAATSLAKLYQGNEEHAKIAAIAHDCAKLMDEKELLKIARENNFDVDEITKMQPKLLHGPVGSIIAQKEFGINHKDILNAIGFHTTGRANMSLLEKIIYLADYIEEYRDYPGVDALRAVSKKNLDEALLLAFNNSIQFVIKKNGLLHPNTIEARNDILHKIYYNTN